MINCTSQFSFLINPGSLSRIFGNLHVYSNLNVKGNTTPAGVAQPATVYFYKHTMPLASENQVLPLKADIKPEVNSSKAKFADVDNLHLHVRQLEDQLVNK